MQKWIGNLVKENGLSETLERYAVKDCVYEGKPPTLVDVLKWTKLPFETAEETYFSYGLIRERTLELWNLNSIYLRDQSPELINFLINLNNSIKQFDELIKKEMLFDVDLRKHENIIKYTKRIIELNQFLLQGWI